MPDNAIPVTLSGTIVWYQWDVGESVLKQINVNGWWKDPLTNNFYSYYLSINKNKLQVLAYLENENPDIVAYQPIAVAQANYSERTPYFKWFGLWLLLDENDTPIHRVEDVMTAWEFDMHALQFASYTVRPLFSNKVVYKNKALFVWGQLQMLSRKKLWLEQSDCPENFIHVPGNYDLWQPDFCIWKYEASNENDKNATLYTQKDKTPVTYIQVNGTWFSWCRSNGKWYHIMTISEWVTLARNIEMQDENWTGWSVWNGYIKWWNNGSNINGFNAGGILNTGSNTTSTQDELRQLTLSNGEVIWDFVGNVWELVQPLNLTNLTSQDNNYVTYNHTKYANVYSTAVIEGITNTLYNDWNTITDTNFIENYGPITAQESNLWFGSVKQADTDYYFVWWDSSSWNEYENWLYSILKFSSPISTNLWTRCAYSPK